MEQGANNNITLVAEAVSDGSTASLTTMFTYEGTPLGENQFPPRGEPHELPARPCVHLQATEQGERCIPGCEQPGLGDIRRLSENFAMRSRTKQINENWLGGEEEPTGDTVEHCYAKSKHIQNTDGSSSYGSTWHWAGASYNYNAPLKSPNADTASQDAYNLANAKTPQRRTWQSPTSAGDERNLYGQGKPMAKDSSGGGLDWSEGITSDTPDAVVLTLESRLDFDGTVAPTDLSRATDAREKGRIGIFGSQLSYEINGQVWSEPLGRFLNAISSNTGVFFAGSRSLLNTAIIRPSMPTTNHFEPTSSFQSNSSSSTSSCSSGGCAKPQYSFNDENPWASWVDPGFKSNDNDKRHQWGWLFGCDWLNCPPGYSATYEPRGGLCYCRYDPSKSEEAMLYRKWSIELWHRRFDKFIGIDFGGNDAGWMWELPGINGKGNDNGCGNGDGSGGDDTPPGVPDPPVGEAPEPGPCDTVPWATCQTQFSKPNGCMNRFQLYSAREYCLWCNGYNRGALGFQEAAEELFWDCKIGALDELISCFIPLCDDDYRDDAAFFMGELRSYIILITDPMLRHVTFSSAALTGIMLAFIGVEILGAILSSLCWAEFFIGNLGCCKDQFSYGIQIYSRGSCYLLNGKSQLWDCTSYLY